MERATFQLIHGGHVPTTSHVPKSTAYGIRKSGRYLYHSNAKLVRTFAVEDFEAKDEVMIPREFFADTLPTPIFDQEDFGEALYRVVGERAEQTYGAFYSSALGGIVTDPALMMIHMDDRMVHRGNGVFDTAILTEGHLYQLDQHLERFQKSASMARIDLPVSIAQIRRTILETTAASRKMNGFVRYWASSGRANFGLSLRDCDSPTFYCMVYTARSGLAVLQGWNVKTCPLPPKTPYFATMKSVEYLLNSLALADAQADERDQGIFVDADGFICEGPNMNVGIVTREGEIIVPPFEQSLAGLTIQRLMELLPQYIGGEDLQHIKAVVQRPVTLTEALDAEEAFLAGSSLPIMPITKWDRKVYQDGTAGETVLALREIMLQDIQTLQLGTQHTEVPYGFMTGML